MLRFLLFALGLLSALGLTAADVAAQCAHVFDASEYVAAKHAAAQGRPGARLAMPATGEVSALVLFVQFPGEPDAYGAWGEDPSTEWPHDRSLGPDRRLPHWAEAGRLVAPPGTPPASFAPASASAFYHTMSHGHFRLTGYVYPRVLHPQHPADWYHPQRGGFANGSVRLAHELLTSDEMQRYLTDNPDGLDLGAFDRFRNGTAERTPDGVFDLVIVVHRDEILPRLRRSRNGRPLGGTSLTSFGADTEWRPAHGVDYRLADADGFAAEPVTLGGLRVIDNMTGGSGVTVRAVSHKQAVRLIAHELGHRHFGLYHTCTSPVAPTSDCVGIMGGAYVTMSAPDRLKLGWAEAMPVDITTFTQQTVEVPDALATGQVLRVRTGGTDRCGDLLVEARRWTNPWDAPPDGRTDDGDDHDLFLPQEGLYLYKAAQPGDLACGGHPDAASELLFYSSLENNGLIGRLVPFAEGTATRERAFRIGGTYQVAYTPGDTYGPHARPRFAAHTHPRLDAALTLTGIERTAEGFLAQLWSDYLAEPPDTGAPTVTAYPNPFVGATTLRYEVPEAAGGADVQVDLYDALGRHLVRLAQGPHQAGVHEVPVSAPSLSAGVYWARLRVDGLQTSVALHAVR